jgi:hypothetical protein
MSRTPSNKGRKNADFLEKIKDKKYNQSANHKLAIRHDLERKRKLFNLNQSLIIIYIMFGEMIVIIAIVERTTHKVIYGSSDYGRLDSNWFYTHSGQKCLSTNTPNTAYQISTTDGIIFSFVKADGKDEMTFQSILTYPELAEQLQDKVFVQKFLYDPKNEVSDKINEKSVEDPNATPELIQKIKSLLNTLVQRHYSDKYPYNDI